MSRNRDSRSSAHFDDARRSAFLAESFKPQAQQAGRRGLDLVHLAARAARLEASEEAGAAPSTAPTAHEQLALLVRCALEDGVLRRSRRAELVSAGRRLGLSSLEVHIIITQVQSEIPLGTPRLPATRPPAGRPWLALSGVTLLATAVAAIGWRLIQS